MRRILSSLAAVGLVTLIFGCARENELPGAKSEPTPVTQAKASPAKSSEPSCCDGETPAKPEVHVAAKPNDAVQLQVVKYNQLRDSIKAQKGKIVVMDVWGTFCFPCRREFPHLVELHRQYAKDGVVCMSVTVDDPEKKEQALKLLQGWEATFPNFLLDEPQAVWADNWKISGVPLVLVIGRDGKQVARFNNDDPDKTPFTYADVRKIVEEQLKKPQ